MGEQEIEEDKTVPSPPPPPSTEEIKQDEVVDDEVVHEEPVESQHMVHNEAATKRFWQLKDSGFTQEEAWDYADLEVRIAELTAPGSGKYFSSRERKNHKHQLEKLRHHIRHLDKILAQRKKGHHVERNSNHEIWNDDIRAQVIDLRKQISEEDSIPKKLM